MIVPAVRADVNPAWHLYPIRLELERLSADRAEIFRALRGRKHWGECALYSRASAPVLSRPVRMQTGDYPVAEDAYERLISLPMFHGMREQDVEDVIAAVGKVTGAYRR